MKSIAVQLRLIMFLLGVPHLPAVAQFTNPLAIPPLLELDTFDLVLDEHETEFYPGVLTSTCGVNGDYLGPTLVLHEGDSARIRVHNELSDHTSMHWHGFHVPGEVDGGPPRMVMPGEMWDVRFQVRNPAATYWYHPHIHGMTAEQVHAGLTGLIIVRDEEEAALELPRTYGVDDLPIIVQDRKFLPNGDFDFYPLGDSVLVNGTPRAYVECPAQVVRLRLLNGANARIYRFGFDDDREFQVIAGDGGLLTTPAPTNRLLLSNGERAEVLLDLTGMEGDSLLLMSFGTELTTSMPGSSNTLFESSALNGIDYPVLRIRVGAPTADPVTTMPTALVSVEVPSEADVDRTRVKSLAGSGTVGTGSWNISGLSFDMDVINDTVILGQTERWFVENASDIAHPFHIHGLSFYVLERNGGTVPAWEQGPKDMVMVDMGESVKLIMRFEDYSDDGWPLMYHCHNLFHEDDMMMLQYIVLDPNVAVNEAHADAAQVRPVPTSSRVRWTCDFPVNTLQLLDLAGRPIRHLAGQERREGDLDLTDLPTGAYVLELRNAMRTQRLLVVRE